METSYEDALRIDHEAVKARALALRNEAIDSTWSQLASKVAGFFDSLRLDATPGRTPHRSG